MLHHAIRRTKVKLDIRFIDYTMPARDLRGQAVTDIIIMYLVAIAEIYLLNFVFCVWVFCLRHFSGCLDTVCDVLRFPLPNVSFKFVLFFSRTTTTTTTTQ